MRARCLGGFSVMLVTKSLISPVKIWIFCPKTTKIGIFGHLVPGLNGSFGWWLWRAGCISQDTYLLYLVNVVHQKLTSPRNHAGPFPSHCQTSAFFYHNILFFVSLSLSSPYFCHPWLQKSIY